MKITCKVDMVCIEGIHIVTNSEKKLVTLENTTKEELLKALVNSKEE